MELPFRLPASPVLALLALSAAHVVCAQTPATSVVTAPSVVVTAPRLTESPATVSTLELSLETPAFQSTAGLSARAANFYVGTNDARSFNDTFALRGLTNTPIFGGPAISFYLDELPLGSSFTFPTELAGFARSELHRGPTQNTVFGRAGSAGVVTFVTPEPTAQPSGELRASFGSYDARTASAQVRSTAGGQLDAYVSAAFSERDGYVDNTALGRDVDFKESLSGLARVRYRPTTTAELSLLVTAQRARDCAQPLVPLGGPFFTVERGSEGETHLDAYNAALTASLAMPIGRLSATTSASDWDLGPYSSVLAFGPQELTNLVSQRQRNWNEELKLVSDPKASLHWQAGVFLSDGKTEGSFTRNFGPFTFEESVYTIDALDAALFGEASVKVAERLTFTAGLRLEGSRKTMDRVESVPTPQIFALERESTALLPKLAASYAWDDATTVFGTVGAGYKPGGFSAFTGNRALAAFGPERTKTIEAGITRSTPGRTVVTTLRAFYYDITGYQIERSFATSAVADDYLVVNAPRARSFGGELEFAWKPFEGLMLAVDIGATQVELREFRDPYTGVSYAGNRAPFVPTYDASVRVDYRDESGWFSGVELNANGKTYYTEAKDLFFGQRSYALLRARIGYAADRYRVTLFGDNLGDEDYYSAISPGTFHGVPGAPRTWGVEAMWRW